MSTQIRRHGIHLLFDSKVNRGPLHLRFLFNYDCNFSFITRRPGHAGGDGWARRWGVCKVGAACRARERAPSAIAPARRCSRNDVRTAASATPRLCWWARQDSNLRQHRYERLPGLNGHKLSLTTWQVISSFQHALGRTKDTRLHTGVYGGTFAVHLPCTYEVRYASRHHPRADQEPEAGGQAL